MVIDEQRVRALVQEVVERLSKEGVLEAVSLAPPPPEAKGRLGIYPTVEEAIRRAAEAQKLLLQMTLKERGRIVENIRKYAKENARRLAQMAHEETEMGRFEDKIRKNQVAADMSPGVEDIVPEVFRDHQGVSIQEGFPYGVICAICPITNPTATVINNSIIMVAAGNAVVFCPHPGAKECTLEAIHVCNQAIVDAGGPSDLLTTVAEPSVETARETMRHELASLLVATGGPAVVRVAMGMGKEVIAAGPGNPVVLVDETADIPKAASDIVAGAFFDNNLLCVSEKVIFPVEQIVHQLIREMQKEGAFLVEPVDVPKLERLCFPEGRLNRDLVGKDATFILKQAGISAPEGTKIAILEISLDSPLVMEEQLMPVVPIVRARDFEQALEFCKKAERGWRHTSIIHSQHMGRVSRFIKEMQTVVLIVNGSSLVLGGVGAPGYCAWSLATGTGHGFTRPRTFLRQRRVVLSGFAPAI